MAGVASGTSARGQSGGLPAEVSSFVGRRREVAEVKRLLSRSRLVTLTGVGGVGKTRLALRVAGEVRRAFPDGVWVVDLVGLREPELLASAMIQALGIRDHSSRPGVEVLAGHLRDRRALMVLDNCEHLVEECAVVAETLVRCAPGLRVLATSQQMLGIAGERRLVVPTLPLPGSDGPRGPARSARSLVRGDAMRLFVDRARAVRPGFAVTADNREDVEQICRKLDGIPLAIELAAVRLRMLSVRQLLDRLEDRFRLLTTESPAVLPRHRTLRALIDWSYTQCTGQEQLLWARASVFAGGLDLEAAEEVCSGDDIDRAEVIDLVVGLVDKSILVVEDHPSTARYRLLETIQDYGRERLADCGQQEAVLLRRHRDHYRHLAAELHAHAFGPEQEAWLARLRPEHANLRAALEYCYTEPGQARTGLDMAADLIYYWSIGYHHSEGRRWLDWGLALDTEPTQVRARALWDNASLAVQQGEISLAEGMLKESRAIGEQLGEEPILAYVTYSFAWIAAYRGDIDTARDLAEEGVARFRALGDPRGLALALISLSQAHSFLGDIPRAVSTAEECIRVCDAHRDGWHKVYMMTMLGTMVWREGDIRRAADLARESLRFARTLDTSMGAGLDLELLAWAAAADGRYQNAARLLGVVQTLSRRWGESPLAPYGYERLLPYHQACESKTRQALGERAFHAALEQGAGLSDDAALAYALQEHPPEPE